MGELERQSEDQRKHQPVLKIQQEKAFKLSMPGLRRSELSKNKSNLVPNFVLMEVYRHAKPVHQTIMLWI